MVLRNGSMKYSILLFALLWQLRVGHHLSLKTIEYLLLIIIFAKFYSFDGIKNEPKLIFTVPVHFQVCLKTLGVSEEYQTVEVLSLHQILQA